MSFSVPSLATLTQSLRAAFNAALVGTDAWIPLNNIFPTAKVVAGAVWQLYGRIAFVFEQAFVVTASGGYLDRHGADYNLPRRGPVPASGLVDITVTAAASFPSGTQFQRSDGMLYASTAVLTFTVGGEASVAAVCLTAAQSGNAAAGTALAILSAAGFTPTGPGAATALAVVDASGMVGGLDPEADGAFYTTDLSTYRGRLLFRLQNPPQGGAPADYVQWATTVSGVTRVFVERLYAGPGTVRIFPLFDTLFASAGGVPDSAHVAMVADQLIASGQPAAAGAVAAPASPVTIDVTIANLSPNTAATQAAVTLEMQAMFVRKGRVAGIDSGVGGMNFLATPFAFQVGWIDTALNEAEGVIGGDVNLPTTDTALSDGQVAVLGTVSFV